jgi:hypothetical protein
MFNFPSQIFVEPAIQLGYLVRYSSGKIRYPELVGHGADTFYLRTIYQKVDPGKRLTRTTVSGMSCLSQPFILDFAEKWTDVIRMNARKGISLSSLLSFKCCSSGSISIVHLESDGCRLFKLSVRWVSLGFRWVRFRFVRVWSSKFCVAFAEVRTEITKLWSEFVAVCCNCQGIRMKCACNWEPWGEIWVLFCCGWSWA